MPAAARVVAVGLLTLIFAGASGCSAGQPPPAASPPSPPSPPSPAPEPRPASSPSAPGPSPARPAQAPLGPAWKPLQPGRCESFVLDELKQLRRQIARKASADDRFSPVSWLSGMCAEDAKGAWALSVEQVSLEAVDYDPFGVFGGKMRLVRLDEKGAHPAFVPKSFSWPWSRAESDSRFVGELRELASPFDYDGDGAAELVMPLDGDTVDGMVSIASEVVVWTFKGDGPAPYPPAARLEHPVGARDVDGDGRPDLLFLGPYHETFRGMGVTNLDVPLLAHSRPDGSFSIDDEVALSHAREQCPGGQITGDSPPVTELRCARLWGRPAAEALAEAKRACGKSSYSCDEKQLKAWAEREPPIRLK